MCIRTFDEGPRVPDDEPAFELRLASNRMTAAELIRARVEQETRRFDSGQAERFRRLYEVHPTERRLNGTNSAGRREANAEAQMALALEAFRRQRFLLFVDARQIDDPEEELVLGLHSEVRFVRLLPLAGG